MDAKSAPSKKIKKIPSPLRLVKEHSPDPLPVPARNPSKISTYDDLTMKLEKCSIQAPLMEGYGCKDVSRARSFEPFRRRYFVLYKDLLIYYHHKSQYEKDKKNGLVSWLLRLTPLACEINMAFSYHIKEVNDV